MDTKELPGIFVDPACMTGGTGIGLDIVRQLVEIHGGQAVYCTHFIWQMASQAHTRQSNNSCRKKAW